MQGAPPFLPPTPGRADEAVQRRPAQPLFPKSPHNAILNSPPQLPTFPIPMPPLILSLALSILALSASLSADPISGPPPPVATPTPRRTLTVCPPPFPAVFVPRKEPLLIPERPYEGGCVVEPNVILGPDGLFHMTYSSNAWARNGLSETISLATSKDLIHWKRYGNSPILGDGHGGQPGGLGMSFQLKIGDEYRIYYKDPNTSVSYATSKDGYHYQRVGVALWGAALVGYCGGGLDSAGLVFDGRSWWAVAETMRANCAGVPAYRNWLFKSDDGAKTFYPASSVALDSQSPDPSRPTLVYAGARSLVRIGGRYHAWLHVDIPSNIFHSVSEDLYNWRTDPRPVIETSATLLGLESCNQAADTSILEHNGKTYLFYDGTDNTHGTGRIGMAVFNGTLKDLDGCRPAR